MNSDPNALEGSELFDLPIAVYVVTREGSFLSGNRQLRQLLGLPSSGSLDKFNIGLFYRHSEDRERLLREVDEAEREGKLLEKKITAFRIKGQDYFVQIYCRRLRRAEQPNDIFYLGCLIDVTEEETLRSLIDELPAGIFRTDENDLLTQVNKSIVMMLGFSSHDSMEGLSVTELFAHPVDLCNVKLILGRNDSASMDPCELRRKDGTQFLAAIRFSRIGTDYDSYRGFQGTIIDIDEREVYRDLIRQTPLGIYKVINIDGRHIVKSCNDVFAQLFGYSSASQVIDRDIRTLHKDISAYDDFLSALRKEADRDNPLFGYTLTTINEAGRRFTLEVNCRLIRDPKTREEVGRIGVLRDVTSQENTLRLVKTLTSDIGNMLHTYESLLVNIRSSIAPLRATIEYDTKCDGGKDFEFLYKGMKGALTDLSKLARQIITIADALGREEAVASVDYDLLCQFVDLADNYDKRIQSLDIQAATFHTLANSFVQAAPRLRASNLPNQLVREFRDRSWQTARICGLISLFRIEDAVVLVDYQVRSLREYVTRGVRRNEEPTVCGMDYLVNQAISNLAQFARFRGVEVRLLGPMRDAKVRIREREAVRAVTNLVHNAIKYTWGRVESTPPWVTIRCRIENSQVHLEIENRGVPIPADEIASEVIFDIGIRGRLAGDRGRIGTGIGLGDAREVMRAHGGDVTIDSKPARFGVKMDDYSKPFLTVARVRLPVYREDGSND